MRRQDAKFFMCDRLAKNGQGQFLADSSRSRTDLDLPEMFALIGGEGDERANDDGEGGGNG